MEQRGDPIELRSSSLRALIELAPLGVSIGNEGEGLHLRGARPRIQLGDRSLLAESARVLDQGPTGTLKLLAGVGPHLELEIEISLGTERPALEIGLRLTNRGEGSVTVSSLDSLCCDPSEGGELELPGRELRMLQLGYDSGSPARSTSLADQSRSARGSGTAGPHTPAGTREVLTSDVATQIAAPDGPVLALGFVSHRRWPTHLSLRHRGRVARGLFARTQFDTGVVLEPGASLEAERFWISLLASGSDGLAHWADRAADAMHARISPNEETLGVEISRPAESFPSIPESGIRIGTLRADSQLPISKEVLANLKQWASAAGAKGIRPAVCFAPFLLPERSELADRHPDWLLGDIGGGAIRLKHRGEPHLVLDPGKSKVQGWLRDLATSLKRAGVCTLELERLSAGTLPGLRDESQAPAAEAYRRALRALRDSLGANAYLIGADAPIGPSIGLLDAVRMGPRSDTQPQSTWLQRLRGNANAATEAGLIAALSRANLHRRLWCNEVGPFSAKRLSEAERAACTSVSNLCARAVHKLDWLESTGTEHSSSWPAATQGLELLATGSENPEVVYQRWPDGSTIVLAINLGTRPRTLTLDLPALGILGAARAFSISGQEMLPEAVDRISTGLIASHGAILLRLVPKLDAPQILGSSLHYSAGALGSNIETAANGALALNVRLSGRRSGRIWYADATGGTHTIELGFEDEVSVQIPATQTGPWERERR